MQETLVRSLGREDPLEEEMATHPSILAWKIPWTGEPGSSYSPAGCKRVRHAWVTEHTHSTDHCGVTHRHHSGAWVLRLNALIWNLIRLIILHSCLKLKWYFHFFLPFLCNGISTNWELEIELFLGARKLFPAPTTFLWLTCKILGYIFLSEGAAGGTEYRLVTINELIHYQLYCRITFQAELREQEKGCSSKTIFQQISFFFLTHWFQRQW